MSLCFVTNQCSKIIMRRIILFFYVLALLTFASVQSTDVCTQCVRREQCALFANMDPRDQDTWIKKYPCTRIIYNNYYVPYSKKIYVCCSDSLYNEFIRRYGVHNSVYGYPGEDNILDPKYPDSDDVGYVQNPTVPPRVYPTQFPAIPNGPSGSNVAELPEDTNGNGNIDTSVTPGQPTTYQPTYNNYNPGTPFTGGRSQCAASSFPPSPESGCCGFEASESDRISAISTARPAYQTKPYAYYPQNSPTNLGVRSARDANKELPRANVSISNRIAGGSDTDFFQFPWTVQLISTFDYGTRRQAFDCGGSLISSRYVLTAGHCIYDAAGTLTQVQAYLSEYDKTTFPNDCKKVMSSGLQCVKNIVIEAEEVVRHSQYDDDKLINDIALIRLRDNAPYTAFIRPICLTPIDIDDTNFANLRLAVAGWGRNGRYRSNIKQSTVVNLVPQEQCKKYYPSLLRSQMCAVGYTGEDTCKGDSGGPLMTVNGQKYYVVGIVSGKRADAPCGTAVPSLYTNVYQYMDWILSNIRK